MLLAQTFSAASSELPAWSDLLLLAPELILAVCACAALVVEVVLPLRRSRLVARFSLASVVIAAASLMVLWQTNRMLLPLTGFYGMVRIDGFALLLKFIFLIAAALSILISMRSADIEEERHGEYYALVLFAAIGMMLLACGYDLIALYVSLELMAVTFYVLVGFTKRERRANEASMKYFLLGAFSSGVLLYGMSLLYGVAGSTNLGDISQSVGASLTAQINATGAALTAPATMTALVPLRPLLLLGMIALAAGLFFKVSAVPFHMWAPDVYEGAPTPVTAFLSTGSKIAGFALFVRIFAEALGAMRVDWAPLLGLVAAVTIFIGNLAAITQSNAKRLLAFSSISNAGYLLLGLVAGNSYGYTGLLVYALVYTLMNMGAFGVLIALRRGGIAGERVDDLAGLAQTAPGVAAMMAIFMLSLGGLPLTGGFIGKYFLFGGLLQRGASENRAWYYWLAGWAIINTVLSFYYYVRFIRQMYLSEEIADDQLLALPFTLRASLIVATTGIVVLGVYPQPFIALAESVVAPLVAILQ